MTARETANQRSRIKFPLTPAQPPPVIVSFYAPSLPCPLTPSSSTSFISVQFPFSRASFPLRSSPLLPVPFHGNLLEEICYSNIARSARRQEPRTSGGVTGRDGKRAEKEGEEIVDGALGSFRGEDLLTNRVVKTTSRKCSRLASNREREREFTGHALPSPGASESKKRRRSNITVRQLLDHVAFELQRN